MLGLGLMMDGLSVDMAGYSIVAWLYVHLDLDLVLGEGLELLPCSVRCRAVLYKTRYKMCSRPIGLSRGRSCCSEEQDARSQRIK